MGWFAPLCHLPKQPLTYPAGFSASARVTSSPCMTSRPEVVFKTPSRKWWRPVSNEARVGEQTGLTWKCSSSTLWLRSLSSDGVSILSLPWQRRSPQPMSSARMRRRFGFGADESAACSESSDARSRAMRIARVVFIELIVGLLAAARHEYRRTTRREVVGFSRPAGGRCRASARHHKAWCRLELAYR